MLSSGQVRSRASIRALSSLRSSTEPKYVSDPRTLNPATYDPSMRTTTLSRKSRTFSSEHTAGSILLFSCWATVSGTRVCSFGMLRKFVVVLDNVWPGDFTIARQGAVSVRLQMPRQEVS